MTAARQPHSAAALKPAPIPGDVAALLRRVVAAVADGTLDAASPRARWLVRRLEQVAAAFDLLAAAVVVPSMADTDLPTRVTP